jgi:hypothetical protein
VEGALIRLSGLVAAHTPVANCVCRVDILPVQSFFHHIIFALVSIA